MFDKSMPRTVFSLRNPDATTSFGGECQTGTIVPANPQIAEGRLIRAERDIAARDRQIDRLVYDLYGLTEEEIAIVEEATQ